MSAAALAVDVSHGVATLTLDRPEKRNALNRALVDELLAAIQDLEADAAVRVVALRGSGPDFCAGADLEDLERITRMGEEESLEDARALGAVLTGLRRLPKPVVAVVHGRALAGGCGLATACDVVLAHAQAELGYPEVHLGFVPAMVMTILRRKIGEAMAFDLVTRGHRITASEARAIGLVTRVLPAGDFDEGVARYLSELAARPPSALALIKRLLYELDDLSFEEGMERGARVNVEARMTEACRDGVAAFLRRSRSGG
ncbi:MAG: enoyl-CoA hydratase-related protein [Gemmatimonadota bacterium]|jgi:methylglutaconyl-CoA hydratase